MRIFPNEASAPYWPKKREVWSTRGRYLKIGEFHAWREEQSETIAKELQSEPPTAQYGQPNRQRKLHKIFDLARCTNPTHNVTEILKVIKLNHIQHPSITLYGQTCT